MGADLECQAGEKNIELDSQSLVSPADYLPGKINNSYGKKMEPSFLCPGIIVIRSEEEFSRHGLGSETKCHLKRDTIFDYRFQISSGSPRDRPLVDLLGESLALERLCGCGDLLTCRHPCTPLYKHLMSQRTQIRGNTPKYLIIGFKWIMFQGLHCAPSGKHYFPVMYKLNCLCFPYLFMYLFIFLSLVIIPVGEALRNALGRGVFLVLRPRRKLFVLGEWRDQRCEWVTRWNCFGICVKPLFWSI